MSEFGKKFDESLDRHITGNYGEDQFKDVEEEPEQPPTQQGSWLVAIFRIVLIIVGIVYGWKILQALWKVIT